MYSCTNALDFKLALGLCIIEFTAKCQHSLAHVRIATKRWHRWTMVHAVTVTLSRQRARGEELVVNQKGWLIYGFGLVDQETAMSCT